MTLNDIIQSVCIKANNDGQVGTLSHLYVWCLERCSRNQLHAVKSALNEIKEIIIPLTKHPSINQGNQISVNPEWGPAVDKAVIQSYENWYSKQNKNKLKRDIWDNLLHWLLDGGFTNDSSGNRCREICIKHGVQSRLFYEHTGDTYTIIPELGFGIAVNNQFISKVKNEEIIERKDDFDRHLGFLETAVRNNKHYVLKGFSGVGKSLFIRGLISRALIRWQHKQDEKLCNARFVLFTTKDFTGTAEFELNRFRELNTFLQNNEHIIPVIDDFENLLETSLRKHQYFNETFGSEIFSGGTTRTWVMVCHSEMMERSDLLKNTVPYPLPPMNKKDTTNLAKHVLTQKIDSFLDLTTSLDKYCNTLINLAAERYPDRFFPLSVLSIIDGTINRAMNRSQELKIEPLGKLSTEDLFEFVAEDLGINPELFGKDPWVFYEKVAETIKATNVIGQDHAVDLICHTLASQAEMPAQKTPRGRFLLLGPPGVGKTELARSLANHIGYGEEGFFRFNMSEYGSESARTRFIGADPGYVGFKGTRTIYDMVKNRPSCVILLDEIDRADSSIQDLLLSMLEGEGNNALNETVYFSQAIFLMTTNLSQELVWDVFDESNTKSNHLSTLEDVIANRNKMATKPEKYFRDNLIKGLSNQKEIEMIECLEKEQEKITKPYSFEDVARFSSIKNLLTDFKQQKSTLDNAFLDRIDCIIPFYPIKEPPILLTIMNLKLKKLGWEDCPQSLQNKMLEEVDNEKESIRPLERIIRQYYSKWARYKQRLDVLDFSEERIHEILIQALDSDDPDQFIHGKINH